LNVGFFDEESNFNPTYQRVNKNFRRNDAHDSFGSLSFILSIWLMRRDLNAEDSFPDRLIPQVDGFLQLDHFNLHLITRHQQLTQLVV
jgi:hypothetical protein